MDELPVDEASYAKDALPPHGPGAGPERGRSPVRVPHPRGPEVRAASLSREHPMTAGGAATREGLVRTPAGTPAFAPPATRAGTAHADETPAGGRPLTS
ncbi:hypothetical protein AN218_24350, partial [Streptomyces nanshensis]